MRKVQWLAVFYVYEYMIMAGIVFVGAANTAAFLSFSDRTGITLAADTFALFCFFGALIAPLILLLPDRLYVLQRSLLIGCTLPIAVFTVSYAAWLLANHMLSVFITVYVNIFIGMIVIAMASFRKPKVR